MRHVEALEFEKQAHFGQARDRLDGQHIGPGVRQHSSRGRWNQRRSLTLRP